MSWIDAMSSRGKGVVNVDALRGLLPVINMIEAAKGQPRSTLSDLIDRARNAANDGHMQAAIAKARRQVAAQEAALRVDWTGQHMTGHKLPGEEISSPEPVAKPQPRKLPENVTPIRRRRSRGITVTYVD